MCRLKTWGTAGIFYSTQRTAMLAKNAVLQNIIRYCTCKPTFSLVMNMVYWWKECGPFMAP
jgi:hypothetical protein